MISINPTPHRTTVLSLCLCVWLLQACGGGGGSGSSGGSSGGSSNGGSPGTTHSPKATGTPAATQRTQPVRGTPTPTPLPELTPPPVVIVPSGGDIARAVRGAVPGTTIVVSPGLYAPFTLRASDVQGSITLFADTTGAFGDFAAPITIDAKGGPFGILLSGIPEAAAVTLDGFTVRGAATAGISVDTSPGSSVDDCTVSDNQGDGIRVRGSDRAFIFNNLIYDNSEAGIRGLGSSQFTVINNTIYNSAATGISVGDDQNPSPDAVVENNIVDGNHPVGIAVAQSSLTGYQGDYNLDHDGYAAGTPVGVNDVHADPQFILPTGGIPDFHVSINSPAVDAADPATLADLVGFLQTGTTQEDGTPDCQLLDIGYHYPTDQSCNVPPTPTVVPTKKPTKTPTP